MEIIFNEFNNNELDFKETIINIWSDAYGRKKNTYIYGIDLPDQELKEHVKCIKKKIGCNGTIKFIDSKKVIQLQGDHIEYIKNYITENINNEYIIKSTKP